MDSIARLTERQKACLRLVGDGYTSKEIGRHLEISPATVDNHVRAALDTLRVENRAEAARLLRSHETGPPPRPRAASPLPRPEEASQPLTSQPDRLVSAVVALPNPANDPDQSPWWRRVVPPLGGTRNELSFEGKSFAILRVAVASMVVLALLTLILSMMLWALR